MFIAILSVILKVKSYVQIHKMAVKYWAIIGQGMDLTPISEKQLRDRLRKSVISLESQQRLFFSYFLSLSKDRVIGADKMINKAKSPAWRKKHKDQGIIPKGLRGIDRQATWCTCKEDGWAYGHGSFSLTSHKHPVLGCFLWIRNSANEAKLMWLETFQVKDQADDIAMDSKADDASLFRKFNR